MNRFWNEVQFFAVIGIAALAMVAAWVMTQVFFGFFR